MRKNTWYLWFFPVIAVGISAWLFADYFRQHGPTIKLIFDDASSVQPEKTQIRFKGVAIGAVKKVSISGDNQDVVVEALLYKDAKHFAVEGSKFSVIKPKVGFQGISGLETIFEGPYISVHPGQPNAAPKFKFNGTIGGDSTDPLEDTSAYILETDQLTAVTQGDNVSFRGLNVGTVTKVNLSKTGQTLHVQINLENRYVHLVRTNTVFWRKTAVSAKLGLFKSELKINSFDSMLRGGVEFHTPDIPGPRAKNLDKFRLQAAPPLGVEKWNPVLESK